MSKISILSKDISELISAGEVVERPASVVKELVENSIDAGATKITIEIRSGGFEYIRVTDNGCGMSPIDAEKAFLIHATSKISTKDDLFAIKTLGFRGEALAAISAVSKVTLKTKESAAISGTLICVEGGFIISEAEAGVSDGTTFEITDLFYNTPARLKFMKSEATERAVINALIEKLAISNTNIAFTYIVNGSERFFTNGNSKLYDAVYSVYGNDFADALLPVDYEENGIRISGFTGKPLSSKPNRNYQIIFVNGRLVKSKTMQQTLEISYKNNIMVGRYPICVLFLTINASDVDVNVHPSKLEIKFSDDKAVTTVASKGIRQALSYDSGVSEINIKSETPKDYSEKPSFATTLKEYSPEEISPKKLTSEGQEEQEESKEFVAKVNTINSWEITSFESLQKNNIISEKIKKPIILDEQVGSLESNPQEAIQKIKEFTEKNGLDISAEQIEKELKLTTEYIPTHKYIGEAFNAYLLVEEGESIIFIDKHALHERIIFERLKETNIIETQTLLTPKVFFLGENETIMLVENKELLRKIGFDVDDFGGSLIVREIPSIIENKDIETLLNSFVKELQVKNIDIQGLLDLFLYTIACKAAIKSGNKNGEAELISLIDEYMEKRDKLKYCPHGRPIVFSLPLKTIDKQFKRI